MKYTIRVLIIIYFFISFFFEPLLSHAQVNKIRAFHIPLVGVTHKDFIISLINKIEGNFNMLIIQINNKLQYDSYNEISSSEGESFNPIRYASPPLSKKDMIEIVEYAKEKGISVVPEVKLFSHQEHFFRKSHPELMFNEVTYNPRYTEVYKYVFSIIDEIIQIFRPDYFHIGHDEVREFRRTHPNNASRIPPYQDFAYDINTIANYLNKKDIKTMIWGDMLLNPEHFDVKIKNSLHGDTRDYYKAIKLIDKNVIIIDWHYRWAEDKFPTFDYFVKNGFKVLGSTWKDKITIDNFSTYVCSYRSENALGMVATTWFHIHKKDLDIINEIINNSAKAFNKCK
ncbi:MAG: family 20 glycosylhydrolase [Candidatus Thorarchaeota archaeon]